MEKKAQERRFRLGILYNFHYKWMGGIVYIQNLIRMLDYLDDQKKPDILLFYKKDLQRYVDELEYPYLQKIEWKFIPLFRAFITSLLLGKNMIVSSIIKKYRPDGLYPVQDFPVKSSGNTKLVSWYADLQHLYFPEFFTKRKIIERNLRIRFMLKNASDLVVSSLTVGDDFKKFYNITPKITLHVFHFVSVIEKVDESRLSELLLKYKLPERYFIVSNQFHRHKNHQVVLRALVNLRLKGIIVHIAFTGKFPNNPASVYLNELNKLIRDNDLTGSISFLGVIPREDQLVLMRNSVGVIQPSLFEGWSTVIEDAKSLQVPVIASSIPVNLEQLGDEGTFFDPDDDKKLAEIIGSFAGRERGVSIYGDYRCRVTDAAERFMVIFKQR